MRLIQLTSDISGESIGLYTCSKSVEEVSEEKVAEVLTEFHELNNNEQYDEADELIALNGIERAYVEQEITVD